MGGPQPSPKCLSTLTISYSIWPLLPVECLLHLLYQQFPKPETCKAAHTPPSSCLLNHTSHWILLTSPLNNICLLTVLSPLHHHLQHSNAHLIYCCRIVHLCSQPTLFCPSGYLSLWVHKRLIWSQNHLHQVILSLQLPEASTIYGPIETHHHLFFTLIFCHTSYLSFRIPWAMSNYCSSQRVLCSFSPSTLDLSVWETYPTL